MTSTLRKISIVGFLVCAFALISAVFIENHYLLSPCPLCMMQRYAYGLLAFIFLIGSIFSFKSFVRYIYSICVLIASSLGLAIAAHQFNLQYFAPPQKVSCSASLHRLIEIHPFMEALKIALNGSPECSRIDLLIFTISLAGWSTIIFGTFVILTLYVIYLQAAKKLR